jgi:DNA adenine methylase
MNVEPFLRWAGGKRWLINKIDNLLPSEINCYYEPFLGGASVFTFLKNKGAIDGEIYLSDTNGSLINAYCILRDHPEELISILKTFSNNKETYYKIRGSNFDTSIEKAAQFIFLNRTSYNGIYRENKKGIYNVPYGSRSYRSLFDFANLIKFSALSSNVQFLCCDFDMMSSKIKRGDFIFLDPPYTVAHGKNGFIKYNQKIFAWEDQIRLKEFIDKIDNVGAFYLLTNASHESITDLFYHNCFQNEIERACSVGSNPLDRKRVKELIFTNYRVAKI